MTDLKIELNYYPIGVADLTLPQQGMDIGTTPATNAPATPVSNSNIVDSGDGSIVNLGAIKSSNFATGIAGWRFDSNGNLEANDGNFRGSITGATGTFSGTITASAGSIGGWSINATSIYTGTEDHSGYTANAGDLTIYSDGTDASIHAKNFYIDASGNLTCANATVTGVLTLESGSTSSISLSSLNADLGTITSGSISVVSGANTIGLTPAGANAIFSGTTGSPEFAVTPAGALTATGVTLTGAITATSGAIGNLTISSVALYFDGATDALSAGIAPVDYPFYAGKKYADRATAPFKVTPAGKLTVTDIVATGTINAQAGYLSAGVYIDASDGIVCESGGFNVGVSGHIRGGQTDFNTGTGFFLGYDTTAHKFSVGNPAGKYLTWDGSDFVVNGFVLSSKGAFGGDGSDGALAITTGTTTINLGGALVVTKNYSSISITGDGVLAFSNPNTAGTIIIIKSQRDVTLTSSATPMINVSGIGSNTGGTGGLATGTSAGNGGGGGAGVGATGGLAGGTAGGTAQVIADGNGSYTFYYKLSIPLKSGLLVTSSGFPRWSIRGNRGEAAAGGAAVSSLDFSDWSDSYDGKLNPAFIAIGGQGGGGSGGSTGAGTRGGAGGGGLYIECGGAWNFTTANGISVQGLAATAATGDGGNGGSGGGGSLHVLYNTLTANSGTVSIAAVAGITSGGGGGAGGDGGNGISNILQNLLIP